MHEWAYVNKLAYK